MLGTSRPQPSARRYIQSAYGEATLPILGGKWAWPGARLLEVVFSERYDNYSDFGDAAKPKVAVRFKPIDDLTLRATMRKVLSLRPSANSSERLLMAFKASMTRSLTPRIKRMW